MNKLGSYFSKHVDEADEVEEVDEYEDVTSEVEEVTEVKEENLDLALEDDIKGVIRVGYDLQKLPYSVGQRLVNSGILAVDDEGDLIRGYKFHEYFK